MIRDEVGRGMQDDDVRFDFAESLETVLRFCLVAVSKF
jgi:hypothetical protein